MYFLLLKAIERYSHLSTEEELLGWIRDWISNLVSGVWGFDDTVTPYKDPLDMLPCTDLYLAYGCHSQFICFYIIFNVV